MSKKMKACQRSRKMESCVRSVERKSPGAKTSGKAYAICSVSVCGGKVRNPGGPLGAPGKTHWLYNMRGDLLGEFPSLKAAKEAGNSRGNPHPWKPVGYTGGDGIHHTDYAGGSSNAYTIRDAIQSRKSTLGAMWNDREPVCGGKVKNPRGVLSGLKQEPEIELKKCHHGDIVRWPSKEGYLHDVVEDQGGARFLSSREKNRHTGKPIVTEDLPQDTVVQLIDRKTPLSGPRSGLQYFPPDRPVEEPTPKSVQEIGLQYAETAEQYLNKANPVEAILAAEHAHAIATRRYPTTARDLRAQQKTKSLLEKIAPRLARHGYHLKGI